MRTQPITKVQKAKFRGQASAVKPSVWGQDPSNLTITSGFLISTPVSPNTYVYQIRGWE